MVAVKPEPSAHGIDGVARRVAGPGLPLGVVMGNEIAALQLAVGTGAGFQTFLSGHTRLLERAATVVSAVLVTVAAWQLTGW